MATDNPNSLPTKYGLVEIGDEVLVCSSDMIWAHSVINPATVIEIVGHHCRVRYRRRKFFVFAYHTGWVNVLSIFGIIRKTSTAELERIYNL